MSTPMSTPPASEADEDPGRHGWAEAESLLPQTPVGAMDVDAGGAGASGDARRARLALYGSHFLSTWGQRAWEFAVGLVLLSVWPSSLLLVSVFGLCAAGAQVLLGPWVGGYVDRVPRLQAACTCYVLQNASVAASAGACLGLMQDFVPLQSPAFWALVCVAIAAGCLSSVGAMGATVSVEREWTRALCRGQPSALAEVNAVMKRIDLTCLIASPIAVGLLMQWKAEAAVVAVVAWNLAAWAPECALLTRAQAASPALRAEQPGTRSAKAEGPAPLPDGGGDASSGLSRLARSFVLYAQQPTVLAAFSLSLLYLTVLSFGTLMTAYLNWRGIGEAELAIYRGLGALSGILATLAFPPLQRSLGLVRVGAAAVWAQLSCLVLGLLPMALGTGGAAAAPRALVAGLVASRFGLWLFDLAVNQAVQESADPGALGSVSGVQGSLQMLFQMLSYAAGVAVWQPERFWVLMAASVGAVATAAGLFTAFALRSGCGRGGFAETQPPAPLTP